MSTIYIGLQPCQAFTNSIRKSCADLLVDLKFALLSVITNIEQVSLQEIKHKMIQKNGFRLVARPMPLITVKYRYISRGKAATDTMEMTYSFTFETKELK